MPPVDSPLPVLVSSLAAVRSSPLTDLVTGVAAGVAPAVRSVSFWGAVVLPFTYLPLLAADVAMTNPAWFVGLLAVNALAAVLGHSHHDPTA